MAFGAQGLTQAERNYEMLAIVYGCEKFDQFVYGWKVTVETDHKSIGEHSSEANSQFTEETTMDDPAAAKV